MKRQLRSLREAATAAIDRAWEARLPDSVPSPLAMVDGGSGLKQVQLNPTIVMVSLVRDENGQISKHAFRDKLSKL